MRWIRALVKGINGFSTITANTIRWLVLIMMSITAYDVVARYFFNSPTIWAYELVGLLLGSFWLVGGVFSGMWRYGIFCLHEPSIIIRSLA